MRKWVALVLLLVAATAVASVSLSSTVRVRISSSLVSTGALSTAKDNADLDYTYDLAAGTGDSQIDTIYQAQRSLAAGASETLDLSGSLTNNLGGSAVFGHVKLVYIRSLSSSGNLIVGNASQAWEGWISASGTETIASKGTLLHVSPNDGWAVVNGVSDGLKITSSDTAVASYIISIQGTSS